MSAAEYLAEVKARADGMPRGPWRWAVDETRRWVDVMAPDLDNVVATTFDDDLGEFIAAARTDVPRLVAAVEAVLALDADEWGSRADDVERCAYCRRKWSKHTDDDASHYLLSTVLAEHYLTLGTAITTALGVAQ